MGWLKRRVQLGDDSRDLSDELVDINAMAVNAFTWIQWEVGRHLLYHLNHLLKHLSSPA